MTEAEQAAKETLRRHEIDAWEAIPVEKLAEHAGARLVYEPFDGDVSGMILRDGERTVIAVNSAHSKVRQRFTIAHEIGHLILHEGRPLIVDSGIQVNLRDQRSSQASSRQEIEANRFAAELLMPAESVGRRAEQLVGEVPNLSDDGLAAALAETYHVSRQSMTYRLVNLGILSPLSVGGE